MQYFLDTEFHEDGKTIDLISIALVAMDGRELYLGNSETELHRASPWLWQNVIPKLPAYSDKAFWQSRSAIQRSVEAFFQGDKEANEKIEIWTFFGAYDWVIFCQLFGRMIDMPAHLPKFDMDIRQLRRELGDPPLPKQIEEEHVALHDARWNRQAYLSLETLKPMSCERIRTMGLFPNDTSYRPNG